MPNISMINLADLQNAVPNKQKLKKKKPKDEQPKPELDIHSIPAPHKIKARTKTCFTKHFYVKVCSL